MPSQIRQGASGFPNPKQIKCGTVKIAHFSDGDSQANIDRKVRNYDWRRWHAMHGRQVPPPPLTPSVEAMIREWFDLVDDNGSNSLDSKELEMSLKVAHIPCSPAVMNEMIEIMDFTGDQQISWEEFHTFISYAVHEGQDLLNGELVLPSGLSLSLGLMIHKLRRRKVMEGFFQGGPMRILSKEFAQKYVNTMKSMLSDVPCENTALVDRSHSCMAKIMMSNETGLQASDHHTGGKTDLENSSMKLPSLISSTNHKQRSHSLIILSHSTEHDKKHKFPEGSEENGTSMHQWGTNIEKRISGVHFNVEGNGRGKSAALDEAPASVSLMSLGSRRQNGAGEPPVWTTEDKIKNLDQRLSRFRRVQWNVRCRGNQGPVDGDIQKLRHSLRVCQYLPESGSGRGTNCTSRVQSRYTKNLRETESYSPAYDLPSLVCLPPI